MNYRLGDYNIIRKLKMSDNSLYAPASPEVCKGCTEFEDIFNGK